MSDRTKIQNLLIAPSAFTTSLLAVFIDNYGTEGISWSPETILMELSDDYAVKIPSTNFDKLMAGITVITTNNFYKSLPDFITLTCAINGNGVSEVQIPDLYDTCWSLLECVILSPPEKDDPDPFTPEIQGFIAALCKANGILVPPDILAVGLRDESALKKVQADFTDDPELAAGIWGFEKQKTDDINQFIKTNLTALMQQLQSIPLISGNTQAVTQLALTNILQHEQKAKQWHSVI